MIDRPVCCVVDQLCEAAAGFSNEVRPQRICTCFVCGEDVCKQCSTRRKYLHYGKVRICNNCQVDRDGNDEVVMRRLRKRIKA